MAGQTETKNKDEQQQKKKNKNMDVFEFCKVCNLNQDQGRRHIYFPNHKRALSSFFTRFLRKISDVRFFLKNPTVLHPELASRNRFWCVFCESDIDELGSSFACSNAINHLASHEHLKNLKCFLKKHGGRMDRVDSFIISEAEVNKWEEKRASMRNKNATSGEGSRGRLVGPSNDIHYERNYENIDTFDKTMNNYIKSNSSNGVIPLQCYTNERYQVSHPECPLPHGGTSLPAGTNYSSNQGLAGHGCYVLANGSHGNPGMYQVYQDEGVSYKESSSHGLQKLTQNFPLSSEEAKGNVLMGAPPPWLDEEAGEKYINYGLNSVSRKKGIGSLENKPKKSSKLNPKRVGAAWAERRKIEMEKEKRGEIVTDLASDWLPNFGRVWQSGSRKESRIEFEKEKQKVMKLDEQAEVAIEIQPYISKRMRKDAGE